MTTHWAYAHLCTGIQLYGDYAGLGTPHEAGGQHVGGGQRHNHRRRTTHQPQHRQDGNPK